MALEETGPRWEMLVVVVDRKNLLVPLPLISRCAFPRKVGEWGYSREQFKANK